MQFLVELSGRVQRKLLALGLARVRRLAGIGLERGSPAAGGLFLFLASGYRTRKLCAKSATKTILFELSLDKWVTIDVFA